MYNQITNINDIIYNKLSEYFDNNFNQFYETESSDNLLDEGKGSKFYDTVVSKGFKPEELFPVRLTIDKMTEKAKKNLMKVSRETEIEIEVPIDETVVKELIEEFNQAKEEDDELYNKFVMWSNWYTNFNQLMFGALPESDACLFLAATAFCSSQTALDVNIIEAAKLFSAVKTDYKRGNAGIQGLKFVANNVRTVDKQEGVTMLEKLANANLSYANLLVPKRDTTGPIVKDTGLPKQIREISVSNAKLVSYNRFVLYYIENNGKLTKAQIMKDLQSGVLDVGGSKVYTFFINLIDPDYEWVDVAGSGNKIEPATIDRWMVKIFFIRPIEDTIKELVEKGIMQSDKRLEIQFMNSAVMKLFGSEHVRRKIVLLLNKYSREMGIKAHQLQAYGWVKFRADSGAPSAEFSTFEDVVNFTKKISDRIDDINPELNFIHDTGDKAEREFSYVLPTIKLLAKIPRWQGSKPGELERAIKNWKEFHPEYDLDTSDKVSSGGEESASEKIALATKEVKVVTNELKNGKWEADMKFNKTESFGKFYGKTKLEVLRKSMDWIRKHRTAEVLRKEKQKILAKKK